MTAPLHLPSAGPDPIPGDVALAAVLGYARGRRPLHYRAPNARTGRWVEVPAFGFERFDRRPRGEGALGQDDILTAEGLHGRLDPDAWWALAAVLPEVQDLADAAVDRAVGRPFWELPEDEFSVLAEPGTVGALLRQVGDLCAARGASFPHVAAALHSRRPELFPVLHRTTRWPLLPHVREGDSGVEAVIHRELLAGADAFGQLEDAARAEGLAVTRLRLHDVLLWLSGTLRLAHAVEHGRISAPHLVG